MAKRVRWKPYWIAVIGTKQGTALLSTARKTRSQAIKAYVKDVGGREDWNYWRRNGVSCQRVEIAVRNATVTP